MIKIATWNVNSINARIEQVIGWLKEEKPDIALLQELKCTNDNFPLQIIEDFGYNIAVMGQKTYNGVAILSKYPLSDVTTNFTNNPIPDEARFIQAQVNFPNCAIIVASAYVPNGQDLTSDKYQIKLNFLKNLSEYYKNLLTQPELLIVGGDFNVALTEIDVYDALKLDETILFSSKEKRALREFIASGFIDLYRIHNPNQSDLSYSWWDYRGNSFNQNKGMRIDYLFGSPEAAQICTFSAVSKEWRAKSKPSDHAPVVAMFDLTKMISI